MAAKKVDVRRLKDFALRLPRSAVLRDLLLTEDDELEVNDFLAKMDLWLRLLNRESS
jgi:hypothetical protein